jgi:NAD(P)-dependent dehydrogenase (short-subunit alcohol dehydrogenase family)
VTAEQRPWALILGASSGFGEAAGRALAQAGFNIAGVHLDRRQAMAHVDALVAAIEESGSRARFFNVNAADPNNRAEVLDALGQEPGAADGGVRVLLHSLAFGTLKPFISSDPKDAISQKQMDMTLDVMAHSLVYWTQDLVSRGLMGQGGRIFGMTSSGGTRVWPAYGAVSAAKAALESHLRQLSLELAPLGITANAIRAGVTDTPALRKIPGSDVLIEGALAKNPTGRLTTPEDVAQALVLLVQPGAQWISGNVIGVDGGEDITG